MTAGNYQVDVAYRVLNKCMRVMHALNPLRFQNPGVLVLGVYLADRHNLIRHIVQEFGESIRYRVTQRWAALNGEAPAPHVAKVTYIKASKRFRNSPYSIG